MTELKITQADRDAAANWCAAQPFPSKQAEAPSIILGEHDHHSLVQAFASHRIAAEEGKAELVGAAAALLAVFDGRPNRDGWYDEPVHEDEVLALRAALARVRGEG